MVAPGRIHPMSSSHPFPPPPGDLCRVLCVDDDPVMQRFFVRALMLPGFAVECVCGAREALERFDADARGFDVLVTDHIMPELDGCELVAALNARGFAGIILVVSGAFTPRVLARYQELGVECFLEKPVDIDALRTAVTAAASIGSQS